MAALARVAVFLLTWVSTLSAGAEIACRAEVDRAQVSRSDQILLTVTVEGDAGWSADFKVPDIPGVRVHESGTNQSMVYSAGRTVTTLSRSYYLQVDTGESFTIGPVEIRTNGEVCHTEPVQVKVVKTGNATGGVPPADSGNRAQPEGIQQPAAPRSGSSRNQVRSPGGQPGDDVFVTLETDLPEAWVGQQIILSFKYYRRIQPWNNPSYVAPRTEGFWRESMGQEKDYRKVVAGQVYNVTEISYALFPARGGELVIEPAELTFREDVFDRFFNSRRRAGPRVYRTEPITVNVKTLPQPAPEDFSGLVATRVNLEVSTKRSEVPRGEPVDLKTRLVSDGFLKGFTGLVIPEPETARVHEAGEDFRTTLGENRLLSALTVDKVLVPRQEGRLDIPAITLSWFDAGQGSYRISRGTVDPVQVMASDLPVEGDDASGFLRSEIARLTSDLAFVHQPGSRLRREAPLPVGSPLWWGLLLVPVVMLGIWRGYLAWLTAQRRDPAGMRRRAALGVAHKRLKAVLQESDAASRFNALARAVTGYVAAVLNRPEAAVSAADVQALCTNLGREDLGRLLAEALIESDSARYGGGVAVQSPEDLVRAVEEALTTLSQELSKRGGARQLKRLNASDLRVWIWLPLMMVLGAVLFILPARAQSPSGPGVDPLRLVAEGNQAYTTGDLETARNAYRQARDLGIDDAVVHFNLGNVYARRGELGQAVASYLRAQRLSPRDADVRNNLAWVRSHIRDLELSQTELPLFIAQLHALEESLTLGEWSTVLILLVWLLSLLMAWAWYRGGFQPNMRRVMLLGAGVLLVVLVVTGWRYQREEIRRQAVVVAPEVAVLSGPDTSFTTLFEIHDGLTVYIEEEREGWARIGMGGDWQGWIPREDLVPVRLATPRLVQDSGR